VVSAGFRVFADRDRCCGSGLCADAVPAVFAQDDDGVVRVLDPAPPADLRGDVEDARFACPSTAITIQPG
jgi:ferredoxin